MEIRSSEAQTNVWNRLRGIGQNRTGPWICLGVFNDICNYWEKVEGRRKDQRKIDSFTSLIHDLEMGDIGYKGQMHTWSNNRVGEHIISERLDRVLANEAWNGLFQRA